MATFRSCKVKQNELLSISAFPLLMQLTIFKHMNIDTKRVPKSMYVIHLIKLIKNARRFLNLPDSGPWVITRVQAMEKCLNSLLRCISNDQSKLTQTKKSSINSKSSSSSAVCNSNCHDSLPFSSEIIAQITLNTLKLINSLASIHKNTMQSILGGELICLLMRHILLNLLTRCIPQSNTCSLQQNNFDKTSINHPSTPRQHQQHYQTECRSKTFNHSSINNNRLYQLNNDHDVDDDDDDDDDATDLLLLPSGARKIIVKPKYSQSLKSINNEHTQIVKCKNSTKSTTKLTSSHNGDTQAIDNK
ncbi:unnamed protein product [Schistosoma mattheei]|uniref:Uncharacterized protein n=1 Tax=Schistosoma mattheei TaxID=31246 RepID=A0A183PLA7_9TREM|nr:unnamed protein product [Schistosoma mattheei]